MSQSTKLDLDSVYSEIGGLGKFQLCNLLFLGIGSIFYGFMVGDHVFTASRLPHRCAIEECDDPNNAEYAPDWILNAIPASGNGFNDCTRFANATRFPIEPVDEICPAAFFDRNEIIECETYVYERSNSVVYDFGLECQDWLRSLAGTMNSVGALVGLPISGYIADRWGRKTTVVIYTLTMALMGFIRSFSVNYAMYVSFQFLQAMLGFGMYSSGYVLAAECVMAQHRVVVSACLASIFAAGGVILGLTASAITEWRTLSMVLHGSAFLCILNIWFLSESARWLISRNKLEEARRVLEKTARMNGKVLNQKIVDELFTVKPKDEVEENKQELSHFRQIFRSPTLLRRCFTTPVWWLTAALVFYGLSINSVSLSDNMYMNYVAATAIEIPGYWITVILLNRIGRKLSLFCGFMLTAMCCFAFAFTPQDLYGLALVIYLLGKLSISGVFMSIYLFTAELYPTSYRHSLLSFSSTIGRVGSILAPLTPPLMNYWRGTPSVIFGSLALLSAVLVLTQPETRGTKLPHTIEDAENIGKEKCTKL